MGNRIDIYGLDKQFEYYARRIAEDPAVVPENKADLTAFFNYCFSMGLSKARIFILQHKLYYLAKRFGKSFRLASKDDLLRLVAEIEQDSKYSPWTKHFYKCCLKKFYKWLEGDGERVPEKIAWLKTNIRTCSNRLPEELLTQEDVRKLIDAAQNPRDKALIAVLYDSGCRVGELAGLQLKHVSFNKYGAQLILQGKTGMRRVLLIFAYPYLLTWLENHPFKALNRVLAVSLGPVDFKELA